METATYIHNLNGAEPGDWVKLIFPGSGRPGGCTLIDITPTRLVIEDRCGVVEIAGPVIVKAVGR